MRHLLQRVLTITTVAVAAATAASVTTNDILFEFKRFFLPKHLKCCPLLLLLMLLLLLRLPISTHSPKNDNLSEFFSFYLEVIYTIILFVECWWLRMVFLLLLPPLLRLLSPHTWSLLLTDSAVDMWSWCNDIFEVNRKWYCTHRDNVGSYCLHRNCTLQYDEKITNAPTNQHKTEKWANNSNCNLRTKNKDLVFHQQ